MTAFQAFELTELEQRHQQTGQAYFEFLRRPGVSMGLYLLPAGGTDPQHPHAADEVYVVLRGAATLRVEDEEHEVRQGSMVAVDRGREHRFHDVTEDLQVLVVFAPAEPPAV